mgnify:CR=1 FL=1
MEEMGGDASLRKMLFDTENGDDGEEISIDAGADTEVEPVKIAADLGMPTDRQVEEHLMTHIPFRAWCRWCVLGRGRGLQHRARTGPAIPIIGLD